MKKGSKGGWRRREGDEGEGEGSGRKGRSLEEEKEQEKEKGGKKGAPFSQRRTFIFLAPVMLLGSGGAGAGCRS